MKKTTRKLMSLLMAVAIICSMVPAAMAYSGSYTNADLYEWLQQYYTYYCPNDPITGSHSLAYSYVNQSTHQIYCANGCGYTAGYAAHTSTCGCNPNYSGSYNPNYPSSPSYSYIASISNTSLSLSIGGSGSLSVSPMSSSAYYHFDSVEWQSSDTSVVSVYGYGTSATVSGVSAGQAYVTATVTKNNVVDTVACLVTVGSGYGYGSNYDTGHFYITGSTDQLDATGGYLLLSAVPYYTSSVTESQLAQLQWSSSNTTVASVHNYSGSNYNYATGSSVYIYGGAAGKATIYAQLPGTNYYATYEVTVGGTADVSVTYSLTTGESLALDAESFEDFWDEATSGYGSLNYVVFGSASGGVGQLTYNRYSSSTASAVGSNAFYADPSYSQYGIDDVTFTPSAATTAGYRTGTLTVPFTAYGTDSYYSASTTSYRGTMYIMVTNGEVADIKYECTASGLDLVPSDFVSIYKSALNVTTSNPAVYIQFLDTPDNGSLYYNYTSSYNYGTKLTASNIGSLRFASRTTGTYGIDDVTYIPGTSRNIDTVRYIAYSAATGGTPLYVGEIAFIQGEPTAIKYYGARNQTFTFDSDDFDATEELFYSSYITFGSPSSGTLYRDYANGTRVTSTTTFTLSSSGSYSLPSVEGVTFVPATNFSGVVEIPFTASTVYGSQTNGVIEIYVAKTFTDVKTKSDTWAYNYIVELTAKGIVDGNNDGSFAPTKKLSYGEALKLIMEAAGYPKQSYGSGSDWAINYRTLAYNNGIISSNTVNLSQQIDRNTVAEISAKALGLSKAYSITGSTKPVDSTDGYVYALYNAGIITGTNIGGKNYFNGSNYLTRAEVCAIVCRISEYDK